MPDVSSWKARLFGRSSAASPVSPPPPANDKWRHDMLAEAVTLTLNNKAGATLAESSAPAQPQPPQSLLAPPAPQGPTPQIDLLSDEFPDGPTVRKTLSPGLLSEEISRSRESTVRSMSAISESQSLKEKSSDNAILPDDSRASPFMAEEAETEDTDEVTDVKPLSPAKDSIRTRLNFVQNGSAVASRTSFSQDRNREPVLSPMLFTQQQQSSRSPSLFGAFKGKIKAGKASHGQAVDSSQYRDNGSFSPDLTRSPKTSALPELPIGLGIDGSENEGGQSPLPPPPFSEEDDEIPPKPPAKYSADILAFDQMLQGFGHANQQLRQDISGKVREQMAADL